MSSTTSMEKYQNNINHKCQVCFELFDENNTNPCKIEKVKCESCKACAHKFCYAPTYKNKVFLCDKCKYQSETQNHKQKRFFRCCICQEQIGLLKLVKQSDVHIQKKNEKFAHVLCLLFSSSFFVESYQKLIFLQISPLGQNAGIRKCKSCKKAAGTNDSWKCSQQRCQERVHFKCFFQYKQQIDENFQWKHSFGRLKGIKIDPNKYFRHFEGYIKKYFDEGQVEQKFPKVTAKSYLSSESFNLTCVKHEKKSKSTCICEKQYPSSFIFCQSCSCWNHAKCQKVFSSNIPLNYKCLQCKDWEGIIKKRKKPILPNYPNMKIYDYIYIQVCFEKNSYKLTQKQSQILFKLPIVPSIQYYPNFAQNYLSKHLHSEICIQNLRKWVNKNSSEQTQELIKSVKLTKIILSTYQNLHKLRDQYATKKAKQIKCEDVKKLLKEYNKKFMKFNKISILIDNPVKKEYIEPQQIKKTQLNEPQLLKQPLIEQVRQPQNKSTDHGTKNQNWEVEIGGTILILDEQFHQKSTNIKNSNILLQRNSLKQTNIRTEDNKNLCNSQTTMMQQLLIGLKNRVNRSQQLVSLRRQIEIMKKDQSKKKEKTRPLQSDYLTFKICINSLELDLNNPKYEITNKYRSKLVEYLQRVNESARRQYLSVMSEQLMVSKYEIHWKEHKMGQISRILQIHKNIVQLITDLNKAEEDERNKIEYLSQLKNAKLHLNNLCVFFNFFYKNRNLHIVNHNTFLQNLQQVANKMILSNSKQTIKKIQQLLAYEVIVNNFPLEVPWIRQELRKKYEVQAIISDYMIGPKSEVVNKNSNWLLIGELFRRAQFYCEDNKMQYYIPKIEKQLEWYKIQRRCIENIPLDYLFPESEKLSEKKINSQQIKELHRLMRQKDYPENRIKKTITYYYQKLQKLTKNIIEFLFILDGNLKNKSESLVRYEREQVVKWIYLLKASQFQCPELISQIEEILYLYQSLYNRIQEINLQIGQIEQGQISQNKAYLQTNLRKIPIKSINLLAYEEKSLNVQSMNELRPKKREKIAFISLI